MVGAGDASGVYLLAGEVSGTVLQLCGYDLWLCMWLCREIIPPHFADWRHFVLLAVLAKYSSHYHLLSNNCAVTYTVVQHGKCNAFDPWTAGPDCPQVAAAYSAHDLGGVGAGIYIVGAGTYI